MRRASGPMTAKKLSGFGFGFEFGNGNANSRKLPAERRPSIPPRTIWNHLKHTNQAKVENTITIVLGHTINLHAKKSNAPSHIESRKKKKITRNRHINMRPTNRLHSQVLVRIRILRKLHSDDNQNNSFVSQSDSAQAQKCSLFAFRARSPCFMNYFPETPKKKFSTKNFDCRKEARMEKKGKTLTGNWKLLASVAGQLPPLLSDALHKKISLIWSWNNLFIYFWLSIKLL